MRKNPIPQSSQPFTTHISRRTALALGATTAAGLLLAPSLFAAPGKRKVVVWSEGTANVDPTSKEVYPKDINFAIAEGLKPLEAKGWEVARQLNDPTSINKRRTAQQHFILTWGHKRHGTSKTNCDKIAARQRRKMASSAHIHATSLPFKKSWALDARRE
jgi:hypothetical protein